MRIRYTYILACATVLAACNTGGLLVVTDAGGHCLADSDCPSNTPPPGDCLRWRCVDNVGEDGHGCSRVPEPAGTDCTNGRPECVGTCDGSKMDECILTPPLADGCTQPVGAGGAGGAK